MSAATALPSPFSQSTTLRYVAQKAEPAKLTIYDLKGRRVNELNDYSGAAGERTFRWDGRAQNGLPLASGVFFYRLQSGKNMVTGKLLLLK